MASQDRLKAAMKRSAVIVTILALAVAIGFAYQAVWDKIDRSRYCREYSEYVEKYSEEYVVPEYIVYAVIKTESNFESNAVSSAGAVGLMQLMPDTFATLVAQTKDGYSEGMLYDPETNIKYGVYYIAQLFAKYGNWDTAFAAYNAGPGNVDSWLSDPQCVDENGKLENIPYEETEKYVKKVNNAIDAYKRLYYAD
jgi:soluble lytic murein transglycosylase